MVTSFMMSKVYYTLLISLVLLMYIIKGIMSLMHWQDGLLRNLVQLSEWKMYHQTFTKLYWLIQSLLINDI